MTIDQVDMLMVIGCDDDLYEGKETLDNLQWMTCEVTKLREELCGK